MEWAMGCVGKGRSMSDKTIIEVEGQKYKLYLTCEACPEQYDVTDAFDRQVGYLRLRHGGFRADTPYCGDITVYQAQTIGDGTFNDSERTEHLTAAIEHIHQHRKKPSSIISRAASELVRFEDKDRRIVECIEQLEKIFEYLDSK